MYKACSHLMYTRCIRYFDGRLTKVIAGVAGEIVVWKIGFVLLLLIEVADVCNSSNTNNVGVEDGTSFVKHNEQKFVAYIVKAYRQHT